MKYGILMSQKLQLKKEKLFTYKLFTTTFSRYILAWQVTTQIGGRLTVDLLKKAKKLVMEDKGVDDTKIIMDGGPENNNFSVLRFSTSHRLQRLTHATLAPINDVVRYAVAFTLF